MSYVSISSSPGSSIDFALYRYKRSPQCMDYLFLIERIAAE